MSDFMDHVLMRIAELEKANAHYPPCTSMARKGPTRTRPVTTTGRDQRH